MNVLAPTTAFDGTNMTQFDDLTTTLDDLYGEAANWADGTPIETQEQSDALDALDKSLLGTRQKIDALRAEEKKPHDEAGKAVQAKFKPYLDKADRARAALNKPRADFKAKLDAERRTREAAAEAERRAIEEAKRKADEDARTGDLADAERAAELDRDLSIAADDAKRMVKAAKGPTGLRTIYRAELIDPKAAVLHYMHADKQAFIDLVCTLAARDVKSPATRQIPGFRTIEERVAT